MKPISDNELREIISQKIATVPSVETDHLWAGVESSLSSSSSGFMTGILKCVLFVSSFISVITISDSSGFAKEPSSQQIESNEYIDVRSSHLTTFDTYEEAKVANSESIDHRVTTQDQSGMIDENDLTKIQTHSRSVPTQPIQKFAAPNVKSISFNELILVESAKGEVGDHVSFDGIKSNRGSQFYMALSPYLTFHSMSPHAFDEHYITSSTSNKIKFMDRTGVQISAGFMKVLSDRWVLNGSISMDYYQTSFAYQVANNIDAEVLLSNNRIDGGIGFGVGYRINTPIGQGVFLGESWLRHKVYEFAPSSYINAITGYRFSYLIDYKGFKIGPTYGSFFTSLSNEMGQVRPQQFGFTIRKAIH